MFWCAVLMPAEEFRDPGPGIRVEPVAAHEYPSWVRTVMQGFAGQDEVPEEQVAMMMSANPWPESFFGVLDGSRAAAAAMDVHAGLATLFGDSTLVRARGRGLQLALIRHRLRRAAELGCDLATASVVPGGISHRNYERGGISARLWASDVGRACPEAGTSADWRPRLASYPGFRNSWQPTISPVSPITVPTVWT